jgi:hypothetical protein
MFMKRPVWQDVVFSFFPEIGVKSVFIAGTFSRWLPLPMSGQKDGTFREELPLQSGTYEYKFIVDGNWITDPDNAHWARSDIGTINSVAEV